MCDRAIDIAAWQGIVSVQGRDILRVAVAAVHINQAGLDHGITSLRDSIVPTRNDVCFEHVIVAQDVLCAANSHERTECAAAAEAICKIVCPAAGSTELNGWSLSRRVADAAAWRSGHRSKFICQMDLYCRRHEIPVADFE